MNNFKEVSVGKWLHIDFWFFKEISPGRYLTPEQQKDFEEVIKFLIEKLNPTRKFYLYEPVPHCFLALEDIDIELADILIKEIKREYIEKVEINIEGNDENNGEGFLDILNAFTDFHLFKQDNKLTHIIHCCMEFIHQTREEEISFYEKMIKLYKLNE